MASRYVGKTMSWSFKELCIGCVVVIDADAENEAAKALHAAVGR